MSDGAAIVSNNNFILINFFAIFFYFFFYNEQKLKILRVQSKDLVVLACNFRIFIYQPR